MLRWIPDQKFGYCLGLPGMQSELWKNSQQQTSNNCRL